MQRTVIIFGIYSYYFLIYNIRSFGKLPNEETICQDEIDMLHHLSGVIVL